MDEGPTKRAPEGTDVNWVASQVGWAIPLWIANDLYAKHFGDGETGQLVSSMLNNLKAQIDRALATDAGDDPIVRFKYWRKLSEGATKMKPMLLKASLYQHPDYESTWMLVEYDDAG